MTDAINTEEESSYPVRVAARITGLKPELLRAWETRYQAVQPHRTGGGSRRYSRRDLDRLKLLRAVVAAGHRIGAVARLSLADLRSLISETSDADHDVIFEVIAAAEGLDAVETHRLLDLQLSSLGAVEFAKSVVVPLLVEIGHRWERGETGVAAEHLLTRVLRGMLTSLLDAAAERPSSPKVIFATPSDEPHDLGTLVAAVVATRAEATPVFLGADVPVEDLVSSMVDSQASALVLGMVTLSASRSEQTARELRERLPAKHRIWIGGAGIEALPPLAGIDRIENLDQLEAHVAHLILGGETNVKTVERSEDGSI